MSDYAGRNVVVLGLGLTGLSVARYLSARGASVRVADTRQAPPFAPTLAAALPQVPLQTGPLDERSFAGADLIVISPGLPKGHPAVTAATGRGIELLGDIELFARALPPAQKLIAVTGSNGKTTVTSLTAALCAAAGLNVAVAGNIGTPALDTLPRDGAWPDVFVVELSSYQLETTASVSPVAATVLNVTENHLDRYPGIDAYAAAKARIFANGGMQVLNRDDPRSLAMAKPALLVDTFGAGVPESEEAWGLVPHQGLWLARGGALLAPVADLRLHGRHNALNALAALALTSAVARIGRDVLTALAAFEGLPHRMQRVDAIDGVVYINDSKGTTVAATLAAMDGASEPLILIAGGDGKGQDFAPLRPAIDAHCRAVLLIGRDAPLIARAIEGTAVAVSDCATLDVAIARARELAQPGDVVLLSPACASLDQFPSYIDRGNQFIAGVSAPQPGHAHA